MRTPQAPGRTTTRCRELPIAVCAALGALLSPMILAADGPATNPYSGMLQMIAALAVVVGAIAGTAWLLKRLARPATSSHDLLKVIATRALGPRERLVIVEAGESWLLLGVTARAINMLHAMPKQDLPAFSATHAGLDFSRLLSRALGHAAKN